MRVLQADWHATAAAKDGFPDPGGSEIAFLGRSNVGKSSLLNALVNRKKLARTSSSPGKTRLIHWYRVRGEHQSVYFVDLPGYGYARVAKTERRRWQVLIESYLDGRPNLTTAVLLQDIRRDLSEDETLLIEWLQEREIPVVLAITKVDKLKPTKRAARLRLFKKDFPYADVKVVVTSSTKRTGLADLWRAITLESSAPKG